MPQHEPAMVGLTEAATLIDKGESTIRLWLKNGQIHAKKDQRGNWRIDRNSLLAYAAVEASVRPQRRAGATLSGRTAGAIAPAAAEPHSELVAALKEALERERRINDEYREKIHRLEGELFKITMELKALLTEKSGNSLMRWVQSLKSS